jgi:hypothetical protein
MSARANGQSARALRCYLLGNPPPVLRQRYADVREHRGYRAGDIADADNGTERDQANQLRAFQQVLTLFAVRQWLEFRLRIQN